MAIYPWLFSLIQSNCLSVWRATYTLHWRPKKTMLLLNLYFLPAPALLLMSTPHRDLCGQHRQPSLHRSYQGHLPLRPILVQTRWPTEVRHWGTDAGGGGGGQERRPAAHVLSSFFLYPILGSMGSTKGFLLRITRSLCCFTFGSFRTVTSETYPRPTWASMSCEPQTG